MPPFPLLFKRRTIVLCRFVLHLARGLNEKPVEFLFTRAGPEGVAPQPGLGLVTRPAEVHRFIQLLAIDISRKPQSWFGVDAPGIEVQIEFVFEMPKGELDLRSVETVDSNDVEVLVLDPNAPHKPGTTHLRRPADVKNVAAHVAQKLFSPVGEAVMI